MEPLLEKNRTALRSLFQTHTCPNESHVLRSAEVMKLMGIMRVLPDLVSANDVQRYMLQASGKHNSRDVTLTYNQFEKLLKVIAHFSFPLAPEKDKFVHLLLFIRQPCQEHYKVHISIRGAKYKELEACIRRPKARPGSSLATTLRRMSTGDPLSSLTLREGFNSVHEHKRTISGLQMHSWRSFSKSVGGEKGRQEGEVAITPALFSDAMPTTSESGAEDWFQT